MIRQRIADGTYAPRTRVPSVLQLQAEFGIAAATGQKVHRALREDGLIYGDSPPPHPNACSPRSAPTSRGPSRRQDGREGPGYLHPLGSPQRAKFISRTREKKCHTC